MNNWTKLGALYFVNDSPVHNEEAEILEFIENGLWSREKLIGVLSEELVNHITKSITPSIELGKIDKALWIGETTRTFMVKSAYKIIRSKK